MSVQKNLEAFRQQLPAGCRLIAVSKTQPIEKIQQAYDAGQRVFGENRAQEMASKYEALPHDIEWHMIGHLQSNKVKYIAPFVTLIHSIDSLKLLEEVNRQAKRFKRTIPCLLQVHIAEEQSKFGFSPEEALDIAASADWSALSNVTIHGLMGMATFTDDKEQVRREFRSLKTLFEKLRGTPNIRMEELSMGMSGDYPLAIEEGSTMIRIGTAIFGDRNAGH